MSRAGATEPRRRPPSRRGAEAGFTLIEILVVLVLLGLLTAVAAPRFATMRQPTLDEVGRDVVAELRARRSLAMQSGRPVEAQAGSVTVPQGFTLGPDQAGGSGDAPPPPVVFLPDGRSTGGRMALASASGQQVHVAVDWLTGEIRVVP